MKASKVSINVFVKFEILSVFSECQRFSFSIILVKKACNTTKAVFLVSHYSNLISLHEFSN